MKSMYETGILDSACAVLRCEGFDNAIMEEAQSADGPPRIRNILICNSERPRHFMHRGVLTNVLQVETDPTPTITMGKPHPAQARSGSWGVTGRTPSRVKSGPMGTKLGSSRY